MKNKHSLFIGFAGIVFLLLAGCQTKPAQNSITFEYLTYPGFPTVFFGTWEREDSQGLTSTRTFTTNTYRISVQPTHWVLESVSGDTYILAQSDMRGHKATETIRYVDGKLIIEPCGGDGEHNCGGVWVRRDR